jgi:hypothetical protein
MILVETRSLDYDYSYSDLPPENNMYAYHLVLDRLP